MRILCGMCCASFVLLLEGGSAWAMDRPNSSSSSASHSSRLGTLQPPPISHLPLSDLTLPIPLSGVRAQTGGAATGPATASHTQNRVPPTSSNSSSTSRSSSSSISRAPLAPISPTPALSAPSEAVAAARQRIAARFEAQEQEFFAFLGKIRALEKETQALYIAQWMWVKGSTWVEIALKEELQPRVQASEWEELAKHIHKGQCQVSETMSNGVESILGALVYQKVLLILGDKSSDNVERLLLLEPLPQVAIADSHNPLSVASQAGVCATAPLAVILPPSGSALTTRPASSSSSVSSSSSSSISRAPSTLISPAPVLSVPSEAVAAARQRIAARFEAQEQEFLIFLGELSAHRALEAETQALYIAQWMYLSGSTQLEEKLKQELQSSMQPSEWRELADHVHARQWQFSEKMDNWAGNILGASVPRKVLLIIQNISSYINKLRALKPLTLGRVASQASEHLVVPQPAAAAAPTAGVSEKNDVKCDPQNGNCLSRSVLLATPSGKQDIRPAQTLQKPLTGAPLENLAQQEAPLGDSQSFSVGQSQPQEHHDPITQLSNLGLSEKEIDDLLLAEALKLILNEEKG